MAATTIVTTNSLSEQLANIMLSQANIITLLVGFQDAIVTKKEFVEVELDNSDGTKTIYQIPSNSYLYGQVKALIEKDSTLQDILSGNRAFLVNADGSYRDILVSSFKQAISNDLSALQYNPVIRVDQTALVHDLIHPTTKIVFTLQKEHKFVEMVNVKMFKISTDTQFALFNSQDELQRVYSVIRNNNVTYEELNQTYSTDLRTVRYYGNFNVLEVVYNDDGTQTISLQSLSYSDSQSISGTRELAVGDVILNESGDSRFTVTSVSQSERKLNITRIYGAGSITPGISGASYYDQTNLDDLRSFGLPVRSNELLLIFISAVNPTNDVSSAFSKAYKVDTRDLTVIDNDSEVSFSTYFNNKVLNIGEYLKQLINEATIPLSFGIKPDKPTVKNEFFKVVQINQHMTDNADVQKLNKLNSQKTSVFNQISGIAERITDVQARINAGNYKSSRDREVDQQELDRLVSEKTKQSQLYGSLVRDIASKLTSDQIEDITPKFRIRGFWPIQPAISSPFTKDQRIIRYVVDYRYLSTGGEAAKSDSFKYTDANGNEIIGAFSSWNEVPSKVLRKIQRLDGTFDWDNPISENADEININQLDISINPGESVEIRIKACSEAGYPVTFTESDWSDIIRIDFPAELLGIADLSKSLITNAADLQKVELDTKLADEGITEHISASYKETSKYFAHSARDIASGYFTPEQATISLYEYMTGLEARIKASEDKLFRRATEATIEIVDSGNVSHTVQRFGTLNLFAGYYTTQVDMTDPTNYGKIVETKFILKISNPSTTVIELLSPSPGNLSLDTTNPLYSTVPISVPAIGITAKQKNGQIVYFRDKDITSVTRMYSNDFTLSSSIIPSNDIVSGVPEAEQNVLFYDGTNIQKVKTQPNITDNTWIAIQKDHPMAAAYIENSNPTTKSQLVAEIQRMIKYNPVLKSNLQYEYNVGNATEFDPNDRYAVGANSCGAKFFLQLASMQFIQVSGSDNSSYKEVKPGDANAILIPMVFQFRMSDALGHVDGVTTKNINDNFGYIKKIGIDLTVGGDLFKFDVGVLANFRPTTISNPDLPVNILDQLLKNVQPNNPNPSIN